MVHSNEILRGLHSREAGKRICLQNARSRCAARMCDAVRESAMRDARVRRGARGCDVVREGATRDARVRCGARGCDARREGATWNAKTHLCQIICSKGVYIALKTSISCRLLDLGVFFASHLADYLT